MTKLVDVECRVKHETDAAFLIETETGEDVWLPKSMVEMHRNASGGVSEVTMPEWLAVEKGLV